MKVTKHRFSTSTVMIGNYIDSKHIKTTNSKNFIDIFDPSKGEAIDKVVLSNQKDFDDLIKRCETDINQIEFNYREIFKQVINDIK